MEHPVKVQEQQRRGNRGKDGSKKGLGFGSAAASAGVQWALSNCHWAAARRQAQSTGRRARKDVLLAGSQGLHQRAVWALGQGAEQAAATEQGSSQGRQRGGVRVMLPMRSAAEAAATWHSQGRN